MTEIAKGEGKETLTPRKECREKLVLIADNLANYFRTLLKNNPQKFYRELNKFEK